MAGSKEVGFWIELVFRLVLAVFFVAAGVLKIIDPKDLTTAIETYQVLPYAASFLLALLLPWLEVTAGLGILLKKNYGGSLVIIGALLFIFIVALTQGFIRGLDVTCGCFGSAEHENQTNYVWLISRDLALLLVSFTLWIRQNNEHNEI